jgi:hypothetical protein
MNRQRLFRSMASYPWCVSLVVSRQHPFERDGEILSEPPGAMMAGLLHDAESLMVYLQVSVPLVPDFHRADVAATKAANHALLHDAYRPSFAFHFVFLSRT